MNTGGFKGAQRATTPDPTLLISRRGLALKEKRLKIIKNIF